jgi:hypothetical protein
VLFGQVLRLLAQAYLLNGKAATALQCVHNLRKLQEEYAAQPAVFLTAIQALTMVCASFVIEYLRIHIVVSSAKKMQALMRK